MTDTAEHTYHFEHLGLNAAVESAFKTCAEKIPGAYLARIVRLDRGLPLATSAEETVRVQSANHLLKAAKRDAQARVAIGDWVALTHPEGHEMPVIEAILPRHSAFVRKDPAEAAQEQVVIANVDVVFIVQALTGGGINVGRLERELVIAYESGARPVVVLTKSDLIDDPLTIAEQKESAQALSAGAQVIVESAHTGQGVAELQALVSAGSTAAMIGASGVGKSTLANALVGTSLQETGSVRMGDDKGRHTTVARSMIEVPGGGVLIDTPGMRALAPWHAEKGLALAFPEIATAAQECKFADCTHNAEPGCAVVAANEVDPERLARYRALAAELTELQQSTREQAWARGEGKSRSFIKNSKKRLRKIK